MQPFTRRDVDSNPAPAESLTRDKSLTHDKNNSRNETITRRGVVAVVPHPEDETILPPAKRRFLVIRRASSVIAPNALCFPGGGIEQNESPEDAALREFSEEVGGSLTIIQHIWTNITPWHVHLTWFYGQLLSPWTELKVNPREVSELLWLPLDELVRSPDTLLSNLPFLNAAIQNDPPLFPS